MSARAGAVARLVAWRELVAVEKRAAFRDEDYWGRGVPGFGDPRAGVLVLGLAPAAHGANRTGRVFTGDRSGDFLYRAMHRAGLANQPTSVSIDDGLSADGRVGHGGGQVCAARQQASSRRNARTVTHTSNASLALLDPTCVSSFALAHSRTRPPAPSSVCGPPEVRPRRRGGVAPNGLLLICSFHPSQQNTFTGRLTEPMLDARVRSVRVASGHSVEVSG